MDIDLARTFLEIIRSGSFIATAERLHITQTAVTARVHNLEEQLGCRLFVRNRAGARLTDDGQRFVAYATQLVQTWEAARRDLPLSQSGDKLLTLGSEVSLCNPLMLAWAQRLRQGWPAMRYGWKWPVAKSCRRSSTWACWTPRWCTSRSTGRACRSSSCWKKS